MPTALLYSRSDGNGVAPFNVPTLSDTVGATTPELLLTNHPLQVLEFDFPDNVLEGINFNYQNNITSIPAPNSEGIKRINKVENGLKSLTLVINGVFRNNKTINADIAILKDMATRSQVDLKHVAGIIGFFSPNAPEFNLDPNATTGALPIGKATIGYTLESFKIGFIGQENTRYDFQVMLSFGGTYTG